MLEASPARAVPRWVTLDEVRVALWLSCVCACTAVLLAVPAGVAQFLGDEAIGAFDHSARFCFRDVARMTVRKPFIIEFDWSAASGRAPHLFALTWQLVLALFAFPLFYRAYLGASCRVTCWTLGSAVITWAVCAAGFIISGDEVWISYSPALGCVLLIVALWILCARGSTIPWHALKQAFVVMVGNLLVMNVIPERTDTVRFLQTFVLLNLYREVGRHVFVSATYYLTVAELGCPGVVVNREAAIVPVIFYQAFMSLVFRLEVGNYDDPRAALATCVLQGVLEVVLRLTAEERDAWLKRTARRFLGERTRRGTTLITVAVTPMPLTQQPSILGLGDSPSAGTAQRQGGKAERAAAAEERLAIVKLFRARCLLAEMWAEYAGILIGSVILVLGQRMPLYYNFRPYRKYPELFDGGRYYRDLAVGTAVQVFLELVTDAVCIVFERRRGFKLLTVWRDFPKASIAPLVVFALMFASIAAQARSFNGDFIASCNHRDVCWCVDEGLLPGGVIENYCLLVYANNSGRPTA
jgi:hypothetical protein